jgi:hypothetical protein
MPLPRAPGVSTAWESTPLAREPIAEGRWTLREVESIFRPLTVAGTAEVRRVTSGSATSVRFLESIPTTARVGGIRLINAEMLGRGCGRG